MANEQENKGGLPHLRYHKIQLLYKLSKILKKIECDIEDEAKKANDTEFYALVEEIEKQLEIFVKKLDLMICKK